MNTTDALPSQSPTLVARSAGDARPSKAVAAPIPAKLGLGLLVALVVGSIIGSGIFGLPQNFAAGAGAGAILIGWTVTGVGMLLLVRVCQMLSLRKPELDNDVYAYLLQQELANRLPATRAVTTLITRLVVDPQDPVLQHLSKPIGPVVSKAQSERVAADNGWTMAADGAAFRRVVPSPKPLRVLSLRAIRWLLEHGALVIAAGGGAIPVAREGDDSDRQGLHGVAALIDNDLCSSLLARELQADVLVIATDVPAVYLDRGQPTQRAIGKVTPQTLARRDFAAGSMGPKVEAARAFVLATGRRAVIDSLDQIEDMLAGNAGTQVCTEAAGGADTL